MTGDVRIGLDRAARPAAGGVLRKLSLRSRRILVLGACAALGLSASDEKAAAQQVIGGGESVIVNYQLLNSLTQGGPVVGAGYGYPAPVYGYSGQGFAGQAESYVTRPATLLFPPATNPRSRLVQETLTALTQPRVPVALPATPSAPVLSPPAADAPPIIRPRAAPTAPATAPAPSQPGPSAPAAAGEDFPDRAPLAPPPPVPAPPQDSLPTAEAEPPTQRAAVPPPEPDPTPAPPQAEETEAEAAAPERPQLLVPPPADAAPAGIPEPPGMTGDTAQPESTPVPAPPADQPAAGEDEDASQTAARTEGEAPPFTSTLLFNPGSAELSDEVKATLRSFATELMSDGNARVQLLAYAGGSDESPSRARRLSLSRALAVRAYLIDQGVRATRMDVRALGDKAQGGSKDRVDIVPARR